VALGLAIRENELPGEMIERGSECVDHIAGNQENVDRNVEVIPDYEDLVSGLRVALGDDVIWVGLTKTLDSRFKIRDVLFGPFDFRPDQR
jgi:hypothetical protein